MTSHRITTPATQVNLTNPPFLTIGERPRVDIILQMLVSSFIVHNVEICLQSDETTSRTATTLKTQTSSGQKKQDSSGNYKN